MKLFFSDIKLSYFVIVAGVVVGVILLIVIGYLDTKFGIRSREMENNALNNPVYVEILDKLNRIEKNVVELRCNN